MKVTAKTTAQVLLYRERGTKPYRRLDFDPDRRIGNVHELSDDRIPMDTPYRLEIDGTEQIDRHAVRIRSAKTFGKYDANKVYSLRYDLKPLHDGYTAHDAQDLIVYQAHVRGFSKSRSWKKGDGGTFRAMEAGIPYFTDLGINAVELMPVYDFNEKPSPEAPLNYWGYVRGNYYAPKPSYAAGDDEIAEFQSLIRAFHKAGIDVILQMYFPDESVSEIIDILKHWIYYYGIDGFHIINCAADFYEIAAHPYLAGTKLFANEMREDNPESFADNEAFLVDVRRFLRGEDNSARNILHYLTNDTRRLNFPAYHNGFPLSDVFSYEKKHNESNGEGNRDGTDYNYSMNFGCEGETKDASIQEARLRAVKNTLLLTLLSAGIPKIYMGDEVLRTQHGNNNAYCMDAEDAYLSHRPSAAAQEIRDFVRSVITARKTLFSDIVYTAGSKAHDRMPNISVHQEDAWQANILPQNKHFAIYYAGKQEMLLTVNLSHTPQRIGLPYELEGDFDYVVGTTEKKKLTYEGCHVDLEPRSIALYTVKGGTRNVR